MIDYDKYKGHTVNLIALPPVQASDWVIRNKNIEDRCAGYVGEAVNEPDAHLFADAPLLLARCLELEDFIEHWNEFKIVTEILNKLPGLMNLERVNRSDNGEKIISIRQASREIGISPSTYLRIEDGKLPDIETFLKILSWLNGAIQALNKAKGGK